MAVGNVTNQLGATGGSGSLNTRNDFDKFLYLLTQQLQHQDPLEPMDTSDFTNQLVQYSNVEQSIKVNQNLENLISLQHATTTVGMVGYIGKEIEAAGDKLALVDGAAKFKYALTDRADTITVKVKDKDGHVVREFVGETAAGPHEVSWDGKDAQGNQMTDGAYTIEVKAVKMNNGVPQDLTVYTAMIGRVNGVNTDYNNPGVVVGTVSIPFNNILSIREYRPQG